MSKTATPNFGWLVPDQGTENNVWGTDLATVFNNAGAPNGIDQVVKAVQTTANAALPLAGGVMTGRTDQFTETVKRVDKGSVAGAQSLDLSTAQYFTITNSGAGLTLSFTNPPATANAAFPLVIRMTNGGLGTGVSWPAGCKFPSGAAPVLSTASTDLLAFISDDAGTTYRLSMFAKALA